MKGRVWIGLAAVLCLVLLTGVFGWTGQPTIPKVGSQYGNDLYSMGGGGCYELVVTGNVSGTTQFACSYLAEKGSYPNDYFNVGWVGIVINATNATAGTDFDITDFVGSTGTFTTSAAGGNWAVGDRVLIYNSFPYSGGVMAGMEHFTVTTASFAGGANAWNTAAAHEIVVVTGAVRVVIIPRCLVGLTQGGATTGTVVLGVEGDTDAMISSTYGEGIDTGEMWVSADASLNLASVQDYMFPTATIYGGLDIGYTLGGAAATVGQFAFEVYWEALDATGNCTAGTGGAVGW